jgi:hypothetical protein
MMISDDIAIAMGALLFVSEVLGMVRCIEANSIVHFFYLCGRRLAGKASVTGYTVAESMAEALVDEFHENDRSHQGENDDGHDPGVALPVSHPTQSAEW